MTDEKFVFFSDLREKKKTATGAHHKRSHCGKGGAVKFPSDFMTKKEREAMNGEVKSYKLNDPMTWAEFNAMPDDIKVTYITALRNKFNASDTNIAKMLGVSQPTFSETSRRLGIPSKRSGRAKWDADGFAAWVHGVPVDAKKETVEEPATCDEATHTLTPDEMPYLHGSVRTFSGSPGFAFGMEKKSAPLVPCRGQMTLQGKASEALDTIRTVLGDASVTITVHWCTDRAAGVTCDGEN